MPFNLKGKGGRSREKMVIIAKMNRLDAISLDSISLNHLSLNLSSIFIRSSAIMVFSKNFLASARRGEIFSE